MWQWNIQSPGSPATKAMRIRSFACSRTVSAQCGGSVRALEPSTRKVRSEEHTSELQSLMRISYAVFCLKKKKSTQLISTKTSTQTTTNNNYTTTLKHQFNMSQLATLATS